MGNAIETDGLSRSFGAIRAVDGLRLRVRAGSVFGFLGPNGAGKTAILVAVIVMAGIPALIVILSILFMVLLFTRFRRDRLIGR